MTWNAARIDARINEYRDFRPEPGDDELVLLESALFLEEAFGILLSDEEITPAALGTHDSMRRLVIQKLGLP
jgi:hypothetical protein